MLKLIGAALALWIASAVLRAYRDIQRAREIDRIRHEASAQATEQALIREEQERQRIAAQEYVRRQVAIEREQIRLARESAQHTATLAKHEKRISTLEIRMAQAEADIYNEQIKQTRYTQKLSALDEELERIDKDIKFYQLACDVDGEKRARKEREKTEDKIFSYEEKVRGCEKRIDKALRIKAMTEKELEVA